MDERGAALHVMLTVQEKNVLRARAAASGRSLSEVARDAIFGAPRAAEPTNRTEGDPTP